MDWKEEEITSSFQSKIGTLPIKFVKMWHIKSTVFKIVQLSETASSVDYITKENSGKRFLIEKKNPFKIRFVKMWKLCSKLSNHLSTWLEKLFDLSEKT